MSLTRINKTGQPQVNPGERRRLTITVPIQIKRRSGRKLVPLPSGAERSRDGEPTPLQRALARGHRWLAMLKSGKVRSLREIARKERVDSSYVSRMMNLTTLAPDIVAAILDETLPPYLKLFDLAVDPRALWEEQRRPVMIQQEPAKITPLRVDFTQRRRRGCSRHPLQLVPGLPPTNVR